jgi:hypothetical protein
MKTFSGFVFATSAGSASAAPAPNAKTTVPTSSAPNDFMNNGGKFREAAL